MKKTSYRSAICLLAAALAGGTLHTSANADTMRIVVTGIVENNAFGFGLLKNTVVRPNDPVTLTIEVDSDVYLDSVQLPGKVRGYPFNVNATGFNLQIGSVNISRDFRFPNAYFCLRNNDPRVDGFFISQGTDYPTEIPCLIGETTAQNNTLAGYGIAFSRTFNNAPPVPSTAPDPTLTSLDIRGAVGSWGFENLSVFNFTIQRGENSTPLIIIYQTITITNLTPPSLRCNPADIANDDGTPLPPVGVPGGTNNGVTEGDYNLFFATFFDAGPACDIANDDGSPLPPFGTLATNNGVTEGDYNLFFAIFFDGCAF